MFTSTNLPSAVGTFLLLVGSAVADTIHVPGDEPTITDAIRAAATGDTIVVHAGTYPEGPLNIGDKNLTIVADAGPDVTTITLADGAFGSVVRIMDVPSSVVLSAFTITGGNVIGGNGGGVVMLGHQKSPEITTSVLLEGCVITNNFAEELGGGVYADSLIDLVMKDCIFRGNSTMGSGGGAYLDCGNYAAAHRCRFEGNYAGNIAGGLKLGGVSLNGKSSSWFAESCIFSGNVAQNSGGGIAAESWELGLDGFIGAVNCTFSGNTAPVDPAVTTISGPGSDPAVVKNSILSNNRGAQQIRGIALETEFFIATQFEHCLIDTLSVEDDVAKYDLLRGVAGFIDEYGSDDLSGTGDENLRLTPLSAAIDQGEEPTEVSILGSDVYGDDRRIDDPLVAPNGSPAPLDLGAAEFNVQSVIGTTAIWIKPGEEDLEFLGLDQWFGALPPLDGPHGLVRMPTEASDAFVSAFELVGDTVFDGGKMTLRGLVSGSGLYFRAGGAYRGIVKVTERPGESTSLYVDDMIFKASDVMLEGGNSYFLGTSVQIVNGRIDVDPGASATFGSGTTITNAGGLDPDLRNNGIVNARALILEGNYAQAAIDTGESIIQPGTLITTVGSDDDSTSTPDLDVSASATVGGTLAVMSADGGSPPTGTTIPVLRADTIAGTFELLFAQGFPDAVALSLDISQTLAGGSSEATVEVLATPDTTFGEVDFESIWPDGIEDAILTDVDNDGDDDLIVSLVNASGETFSYVGILENLGTSGGTWNGFATFQVGVNSLKISGSTNGLGTGDLDGDGLIDAVVTNKASGTVHVLQNASTPTQIQFFNVLTEDSAPDLPPGTGQPSSTWIGDLDFDGRPDVVVNNETDGSVVTFQNVSSLALSLGPGSSSSPLKKIRRISPSGSGTPRDEKPFGPGKDQENADGSDTEGGSDDDDDDDSSGNVQVGSTAATLQGTLRLEWAELTVGADPVDAQAGDLNGSGFRDIVTANRAGESVSILLATAVDTYDPALTIPIGDPCSSTALGDLDGDGDLDIAILVGETASTGSSVRVLRNDTNISGMPSFCLEGDALFNGNGVNRILIGNLDGDANEDIVVMAVSPSQFAGGGDPGWMATLTATGSDCLGDINGDDSVGPLDLAFLLGAWGRANPGAPADFDNDGLVGPIDLAILLGAWGNCGGTVD